MGPPQGTHSCEWLLQNPQTPRTAACGLQYTRHGSGGSAECREKGGPGKATALKDIKET